MTSLRSLLRARQPLVGTFIKTPSPVVVEVLAVAGLDLVCIDAEHAPFGRSEVDACLAVARARSLPALVRLPAARPEFVGQALDSGAAGVVVPHVTSATQAADIVRWSRYTPGGRGYAGSTRAGGYGTVSMRDHRQRSDEDSAVVVQIEDAEAVTAAGDIAAVDGVDAVFVGRADLAVSLEEADPDTPGVRAAVAAILEQARGVGVAVGAYVGSPAGVSAHREAGIDLLLVQSDQGLLLDAAARLRSL